MQATELMPRDFSVSIVCLQLKAPTQNQTAISGKEIADLITSNPDDLGYRFTRSMRKWVKVETGAATASSWDPLPSCPFLPMAAATF